MWKMYTRDKRKERQRKQNTGIVCCKYQIHGLLPFSSKIKICEFFKNLGEEEKARATGRARENSFSPTAQSPPPPPATASRGATRKPGSGLEVASQSCYGRVLILPGLFVFFGRLCPGLDMLEGLDWDKARLLFFPTCREEVLLPGSGTGASRPGGFFL